MTSPEKEFWKEYCYARVNAKSTHYLCLGAHPKLCHVQSDVLVERIEDDFGDTLITPGPMHEQQFSEETELTDGDIGTPRSLQTLDTTDTDSDVRSLDH